MVEAAAALGVGRFPTRVSEMRPKPILGHSRAFAHKRAPVDAGKVLRDARELVTTLDQPLPGRVVGQAVPRGVRRSIDRRRR